MPSSAPRLPPRLLDAIERLSRRRVRIAEINRLVGAEAERLGLARPSYERVRVLVHEARSLGASGPRRPEVAVRAVLRDGEARALMELFAEPPPRLRERAERAERND